MILIKLIKIIFFPIIENKNTVRRKVAQAKRFFKFQKKIFPKMGGGLISLSFHQINTHEPYGLFI